MMSNKLYDILKWVAQYLLPGLAALYFGISQIWGLPYAEEIVGTITAFATFLGAILYISNATYTATQNKSTNYVKSSLLVIPKTQDRETGLFIKMTGKTYQNLLWIAQFFIPAAGTLYFALASIWGFPYGKEIVGTIACVDVFLGVILGISTSQYKKEMRLQPIASSG